MSGKRVLLAMSAMSAMAAVLPVDAWAEGDAVRGGELYALYCATCHGATAEGDGPTAELFAERPPDLTALAARNEGAFPMVEAARRIDGRDPVLAHGVPMPVYGGFFESGAQVALRTPAGQTMLTSEPVADLLAWLESVQASE